MGLARGINEKSQWSRPDLRHRCPRVRRWCKGVREVLASLKPVQIERDVRLSVAKNTRPSGTDGDVLAGVFASVSFSVGSRRGWRTA